MKEREKESQIKIEIERRREITHARHWGVGQCLTETKHNVVGTLGGVAGLCPLNLFYSLQDM